MKIHRSDGLVHIDLSGAEALWLLEELETVRGGAQMPKLRQVCFELRTALALGAPEPPKKRGRPPKPKAEVPVGVSEAAAALGRLGGLKGGEARAAVLTPEERSGIASKAAAARWGKRE